MSFFRRVLLSSSVGIVAGAYTMNGFSNYKVRKQFQPQCIASNDKEEFIGVHTCVPALLESPFASKLLHGNNKLPPYVIATGNGERVRDSLKYLDEGVLLCDAMRTLNLNPYRVEIAVGLYKGTPVMIFEHQIGAPATEIYIRELLSNKCMTNEYSIDSMNKCFTSSSKYIIRLGTSVGINDIDDNNSIFLKPGDISVSNRQVGVSSTDYQAITSNLNIFNYKSSLFAATSSLSNMEYVMHSIINNEVWPVVEFDAELTYVLSKHIRNNYSSNDNKYGYKCINSLGNVSKDSLYSEEAPDTFIKLRKYLNVGTSDMEAATIIRTAKHMNHEYDNNIKVAFCSIILGTLPGNSFTPFDRTLSSHTQWISALDALHEISLDHLQ